MSAELGLLLLEALDALFSCHELAEMDIKIGALLALAGSDVIHEVEYVEVLSIHDFFHLALALLDFVEHPIVISPDVLVIRLDGTLNGGLLRDAVQVALLEPLSSPEQLHLLLLGIR